MSHVGTRKAQGVSGLFGEAGLILMELVSTPGMRVQAKAAILLGKASQALHDADVWGKRADPSMVQDAEQSAELYQMLRTCVGRIQDGSQLLAVLKDARDVVCTLRALSAGRLVPPKAVRQAQQLCQSLACSSKIIPARRPTSVSGKGSGARR